MKSFIKPLPFLLCFLLAGPVFAQQPARSIQDTAHHYMKHSYDVLKYTLNLDIYNSFATPYPKNFTAKEVVTFKVDTALSMIKLNASNSSLQVDSVGLSGVSFVHSSDTLRIQLNRTYAPGEVVNVKVCYQHKNVTDNAFYASGGYVFTDTPPEGARKWFPCWDRPSDKALTDITVKVPLAARLGSTGHLADSVVSGDSIFYHWVSTDPVATYLITLSAKTGYLIYQSWWNLLSNPADSIPVRMYYKTGEVIGTARALINPMTDFFSSKFGDYPFEKIGFATLNSAFPWGGMENQSMVNLTPGGYTQEDLIAHEHSHQWFGDLITCGTWADIWLNEGIGTYCQKLWTENAYGYAAYKSQMNSIANGYLGQNPGWPIYNPQWAIQTPPAGQLYNVAIVYNKGACVLHQLRYVLGDSLFFQVMHEYATDTNFMFKNAVTEEFVAKVNAVTGMDLNWFFDEWIFAPNHPVYANTYYIDYPGDGSWKVTMLLEQVQTNTVFFTMPVEVKFTFIDGSDTLLRVMNDVNTQSFQWSFSREPKTVVFDPLRNILLKQATTIVGIRDEAMNGKGFSIKQNEPNPFRENTTIQYTVPERSHVKISVLDSFGNILATPVNLTQPQGSYRFEFTSEGMEPGIYYYKMEAGKWFSDAKKMLLVK
jgi:aminopeptidase N